MMGESGASTVDALQIVAEAGRPGQMLKSPLPAAQVDFSGGNPSVIVDRIGVSISQVACKRSNAAGFTLRLHFRRKRECPGNIGAG